MVRIKERYLLVNILYPDQLSGSTKTTIGGSNGRGSHVPDIVALHQPTTDKLTHGALLREVRAEVASLFGDYGAGAISSLQIKYLSQATSTFILRVNRAHYRLVWTALTMMDHVPVKDGRLCTYRVVHVSGTMRKVEEEAIRRDRDLMFAVKDAAGAKNNSALAAIMGEGKRTREQQAGAKNPNIDVDVEDDSEDEEMAGYNDN